MAYEEFLIADTSSNRHLVYVEARQWRDAGLSWEDVLATWHTGGNE